MKRDNMRILTELKTQDWKDSVLKDRAVEKRHTAGLMPVKLLYFKDWKHKPKNMKIGNKSCLYWKITQIATWSF